MRVGGATTAASIESGLHAPPEFSPGQEADVASLAISHAAPKFIRPLRIGAGLDRFEAVQKTEGDFFSLGRIECQCSRQDIVSAGCHVSNHSAAL